MRKEYFFLIFAGILSGLIVFSAKVFSDFGLSLFEMSIIPYAISLIVLLPLIIFFKRFRLQKRHWKILMLYGLITALLSLAEFGGVILGVPVAVAVLLIYTQPLWTVIIGKSFLDEEISLHKIIACFLVLAGVFILINPENINFLNIGIIISVIAGILLSIWIILGRVSSVQGSNPVSTQIGMAIFTILFLIIFYPLASLFIKSPEIISLSLNWKLSAWIYIIIFALLVNVLSHILIFSGMKKVASSTAGIILLLEPLSAAILAALFLGQALTWNIAAGGVLILMANYLVIRYGEK